MPVGTLDTVELTAPLGSARSDPERRKERKATHCAGGGSALCERGKARLGERTWVDNAPHSHAPAPSRSGEDSVCYVSADPSVDLHRYKSVRRNLEVAGAGSKRSDEQAKTHQERKGGNVREKEARTKGCRISDRDLDQKDDCRESDLVEDGAFDPTRVSERAKSATVDSPAQKDLTPVAAASMMVPTR